jgi:cyclophilin family peptidyl-prolyl cis-trans isomerase
VDKGFVAQIQSVDTSSVQRPLSAECKAEAHKNVPAEFTPIRHKRGILSMGRMSDPNSGGSSFSMLLGRVRANTRREKCAHRCAPPTTLLLRLSHLDAT